MWCWFPRCHRCKLLAEGMSVELVMGELYCNGATDDKLRCRAITSTGEQCRNPAITQVTADSMIFVPVCRQHSSKPVHHLHFVEV